MVGGVVKSLSCLLVRHHAVCFHSVVIQVQLCVFSPCVFLGRMHVSLMWMLFLIVDRLFVLRLRRSLFDLFSAGRALIRFYSSKDKDCQHDTFDD